MELGSHWTHSHEICYLSTCSKICRKVQVSLKSGKNKGHFTVRPIYIFFYHISLSSSYNEKCFTQKLYRKSKHTFCVQEFFYEMWKNTAEHAYCMLDTKGYKHTHTICNTYCFSTAAMVARTRLSVTLYVHCLVKFFRVKVKAMTSH